VSARLFVIPGSHPSMAARLMLERKGISYRRIDLIPMVAKPILRALRFPRATVPALVLDGRRVQGSREIARALERVRPEPPLFPTDPDRRAAVEEAERWGDEVLQPAARRLVWWALRRDPSTLASYAEDARLGIPLGLALRTAPPVIWGAARFNRATDATVRADLIALPAMLDLVDKWISEGVLGADEPTAADFQIAPSLRLAMTPEDVRPAIEARPCAEMARRVAPYFPGRAGPVFPREWIVGRAPPLRSPA
jgi:glutathione S-transferase